MNHMRCKWSIWECNSFSLIWSVTISAAPLRSQWQWRSHLVFVTSYKMITSDDHLCHLCVWRHNYTESLSRDAWHVSWLSRGSRDRDGRENVCSMIFVGKKFIYSGTLWNKSETDSYFSLVGEGGKSCGEYGLSPLYSLSLLLQLISAPRPGLIPPSNSIWS